MGIFVLGLFVLCLAIMAILLDGEDKYNGLWCFNTFAFIYYSRFLESQK